MKKEIENTVPVISVSNVKRSVDFYRNTLGFSIDWGDPNKDKICSVSRDGHAIMLSECTDIGTPSCVWIGLESDQLFSDCIVKGVSVLQKPENHPWAYDMKIQDIDGNILWLGTDPKK